MHILLSARFYSEMVTAVLFTHALFILGVVFGALLVLLPPQAALTPHRVASLGDSHGASSLALSVNLIENWLEGRAAGVAPYRGGFLLHYLDKLVYPDISAKILTVAVVIVYALNLGFYGLKLAHCE